MQYSHWICLRGRKCGAHSGKSHARLPLCDVPQHRASVERIRAIASSRSQTNRRPTCVCLIPSVSFSLFLSFSLLISNAKLRITSSFELSFEGAKFERVSTSTTRF